MNNSIVRDRSNESMVDRLYMSEDRPIASSSTAIHIQLHSTTHSYTDCTFAI